MTDKRLSPSTSNTMTTCLPCGPWCLNELSSLTTCARPAWPPSGSAGVLLADEPGGRLVFSPFTQRSISISSSAASV